MDETRPTLLENLPGEIFLQIFTHFSLRDIVKIFFDLNSYMNTMVQLVQDVSLKVEYHDSDAIHLLESFPGQIRHLVMDNIEKTDFTLSWNLRSLTLKYSTRIQLNTIRPQYIPRLETLRITGNAQLYSHTILLIKHILYVGFHKTITNSHETINNLLQIIFTNGFPRLEICTIFDIGIVVVFNDTWTGSPSLRNVNLYMPHSHHREKLRAICPRLRRLTSYRLSTNDPLQGNSYIIIIFESKQQTHAIHIIIKRRVKRTMLINVLGFLYKKTYD